ncbi:MAG: DUF1579 domain-containing protein [bacterium]|nr:DUF1579 domain-containing protein [bacterium]
MWGAGARPGGRAPAIAEQGEEVCRAGPGGKWLLSDLTIRRGEREIELLTVVGYDKRARGYTGVLVDSFGGELGLLKGEPTADLDERTLQRFSTQSTPGYAQGIGESAPDARGGAAGRGVGPRPRDRPRASVTSGQRTSALTASPSITTPTQCVVYSNGSPSYSPRSASLPTSSEPTRRSTPRIRAASIVTSRRASSKLQP